MKRKEAGTESHCSGGSRLSPSPDVPWSSALIGASPGAQRAGGVRAVARESPSAVNLRSPTLVAEMIIGLPRPPL